MARRGLGKGLDVLIGSAATAQGHRLEEIPIKDIKPNPRQPRMMFDPDGLEEMARSIDVFGVVQPIIVRSVGTEYELVAGERRWRAARMAGLEKVPAIVRDSTETDSLEMALIENLHRDDLNGIEEATAFQQLLDDFGITHEELSRRVGKSRAQITNTIRLLQLTPSIQQQIMEDRITTGHARALLALQDEPELQEKLALRIAKEGLSVRQVEDSVRSLKGEEGPRKERQKTHLPHEAVEMFKMLEEILDTRVKGSLGRLKGRLVIEFIDVGDLKRIYSVIAGSEAATPGPSGEGKLD
ncbi:MAG: ParB/RepB/Spo0J family partition protein [Actinobacteria bacterium]|nr:ParB/RepB/Spo0J family partition protein [Actinomycetota bacterium]